jgi:hypothetical protein
LRVSRPGFGAFWHGPLHPLSWACLASFPAAGLRLRLYAFEAPADPPPGVEVADAREIEPDASLVGRYIALGQVSFSKFSNLFRYRMIRRTGLCWVDADILCLSAPDFRQGEIVFGRQAPDAHPGSIGSAVLMAPPDHPILAEMIEAASRAVDLDQPWGVIGPRLITAAARRQGLDGLARPREAFYPVPWDRFLDPFSPDRRASTERATQRSSFLHLWNEYLARVGYDRWACPPEGSFLGEVLRQRGLDARFTRTCMAEEIEALRRRAHGQPPAGVVKPA